MAMAAAALQPVGEGPGVAGLDVAGLDVAGPEVLDYDRPARDGKSRRPLRLPNF